MEVIKSITIETFIKPMKNKNISYGIAESDGRKLEIDLDNLYITFGNNHFDLASIPGTKGGNRYFFLCPICGNLSYFGSVLICVFSGMIHNHIAKVSYRVFCIDYHK